MATEVVTWHARGITEDEMTGKQMTFQQVRDVVKQIRRAHQQLRDALERPRSRSSDARTRMMLDALCREEQNLQLTLGLHGAKSQESLLNTWLQYVPDPEVMDTLSGIAFRPEMSADEVVARKLEFDHAMIQLLQQLSGQTSVPQVQEFFKTLLENLQSRASRQAWNIREYQADANPPEPER